MKIPVGGVAFFDSGVGGLNVLASCQKRFSNTKFYYYGDNERAPYGNLPPTLIRQYVGESFTLFQRLCVQTAVIACNTATALCVDELRTQYPFPIVGAEPAVRDAVKGGGEVFVLTTRATYNSARFQALCERVGEKYPQARLKPYSCDGLAGAIEEHVADAFYDFTRFLPRGTPRAVVLGCTHYIYIKKIVQAFYGCEVFDGNDGIAKRLYSMLKLDKKERLQGEMLSKTAKLQNFRDERPLFENELGRIGIFDHFSTPEEKIQKIKNNTNKCSCIKIAKSLVIKGVGAKNEIYFLGSGAAKNKVFYERMFVF